MNIEEIANKLENAGCSVKIWKNARVYITKTPNGSKGDYGYAEEGDDGSNGTLQHVTKRSGEIAEILRS